MRFALNPSRRYRNDILWKRFWDLRLTYPELAQKSKVAYPTIKRVFKGENAEIDSVWAVADALKIDRHALTNFKLKERDFHLAVLSGKRG